jgi:hypothetical protein
VITENIYDLLGFVRQGLAIQPRLTSDFSSSYLYLLSAGITGMNPCAWLENTYAFCYMYTSNFLEGCTRN